jgi:hypothetical protein
MPEHYRLSPSGANRWLRCPGSLEASRGQPDTASVYANEGTHAHLVASEALQQGIDAKEVERECPAGMVDAVQIYLDTIKELIRTRQEDGSLLISEHIEEQLVSKAIEDFGGTADWLGLFAKEDEMVVHVCDYKHGVGEPVLAEGNKQMLSYLLLAREVHGRQDRYFATIVQPRTNGPAAETWEVTNEMLDDFEQEIREAVGKPGEFHAGDHCRWCPALQVCDTVYQLALETAKMDFSTDNSPKDNVERWVTLMDAASAIKAALAKIPRLMVEDMKRGVEFPGYKAVMSIGNRKWKLDDADIVKRLAGRKVGKKVTCPPTLLSPTKLENLGYKEQIQDLITREEKGPVAVPVTDRRKALDLSGEADMEDMSFLL